MTELTRRSIYRKALELRDAGELYDRSDEFSDDRFDGSVDRFSWIAYELRDCEKVLDIGPEAGVLCALLP